MDQPNPLLKPFHVRTTDGVFHSGHDEEAGANSRAVEANAAAVKLGIQTRYSAAPRP